jgi:flavin reductase (DIM6/NTAB) family NADH-FMN oxidoreductase RutF
MSHDQDLPGEMTQLEFDLRELPPRDAYFLLTSAVVPRPIAWVSTLSAEGVRNLAPYSYFNACSTEPPIVHFTSTGEKDSLRNARDTNEFVVNIVSHGLQEQMRITSAAFPADQDEFGWAGLEPASSQVVAPPRVEAASVALECRVRQILPMGGGTMVFGDVLMMHVAERAYRDGRIDMERLCPVGRLSGMSYATITSTYKLPLPAWVDEQVADYQVHGGAPALAVDYGTPPPE